MVRSRLDTDDLKPRDWALLEALDDGRFVTIDHAARYIWHTAGSANRRVRQLELGNFVRRERDHETSTTIIRPTPLATTALASRRRLTLAEPSAGWTWQQLHERTIGFIRHEARVNELRFVLLRDAPTLGVTVVASCCGRRACRLLAADSEPGTPRPDRYVGLRVPATAARQHFFVEVDCGSKPVQRTRGFDVASQLTRYDTLLRRWQRKPPTDESAPWPFRVLVLCHTTTRTMNIMAALKDDPRSFRPARRLRAYALFDEFVADPYGEVCARECDPDNRCTVISEWNGCPTF